MLETGTAGSLIDDWQRGFPLLIEGAFEEFDRKQNNFKCVQPMEV
jgi:hypothetical protein